MVKMEDTLNVWAAEMGIGVCNYGKLMSATKSINRIGDLVIGLKKRGR